MKNASKRHGLTVIELVLVVVILVILAAIFAPRFLKRAADDGTTATRITRVAGPDSLVASGAASSVAVRVEDGAGKAIPNAAVEFVVQMSGDTVNPSRASADSNGVASTVWTIGATPGVHILTARLAGQPAIQTALAVRTLPPAP